MQIGQSPEDGLLSVFQEIHNFRHTNCPRHFVQHEGNNNDNNQFKSYGSLNTEYLLDLNCIKFKGR